VRSKNDGDRYPDLQRRQRRGGVRAIVRVSSICGLAACGAPVTYPRGRGAECDPYAASPMPQAVEGIASTPWRSTICGIWVRKLPARDAFVAIQSVPVRQRQMEIAAPLTGAMRCASGFGDAMAKRGNSAILNIASDLGVIAPDRRPYKQPVSRAMNTARPRDVLGGHVSAISPNNQEAFVEKLTRLIPMGVWRGSTNIELPSNSCARTHQAT
jgi:hypothetical protein